MKTAPRAAERTPPRTWRLPVRPASRKYPVSHHCREARGSTEKPTIIVPASAAVATAASRNLLVRRRYGMKMRGTSLMPAAKPMPAPRHQRREAVRGRLVTVAHRPPERHGGVEQCDRRLAVARAHHGVQNVRQQRFVAREIARCGTRSSTA